MREREEHTHGGREDVFLNRDSEGRGKENSLRECGVWRATAAMVVVVGSDEQRRDKNDSSLSAHYTHAHTQTHALTHGLA